MKRSLIISTMLLLLVSVRVGAQSPYLSNLPLPYMPVKLDVLFIGNSYSLDTSALLPDILSSMGINTVNVYVLYKGACSMKEHYENFVGDKNVYEFYQYNSLGQKRLEKKITIRAAMRRCSYDVVIFQQYSLMSGDYSTYEPYLSWVIQAYKLVSTSPRTTFAFNQTWAWASDYKNFPQYYASQSEMWQKICNSVRSMRMNSGIDVIIPCGTAIQNLRSIDDMKSARDYTRDGTHLDLNAGRYVAACTLFESIIGPCLGRSIREDISIFGKASDDTQVNNGNRRILQNCARLAVANHYEVSKMAGE